VHKIIKVTKLKPFNHYTALYQTGHATSDKKSISIWHRGLP